MLSKGSQDIDYAEVKNKIDEFQLANHYFGVSKIPCLINSPLRRDENPSFGFYSRDGIRLFWKDYATKEGGGIYDLLMKVWGISFGEVLKRIVKDFPNLTKGKPLKISKRTHINKTSPILDIKCKVRPWQQHDIDYWSSYGISLEWLKFADVYPISHKIIIKENDTYVMGADKYAYAYVERKEGKVTLKIYQPFNKKFKWASKHDKSVISLWTKVPKTGARIVICSSLKDALCLWANTGIPAIAVQGEGFSISNTAISELKKRFDCIYLLFDNDEPGLKDGEQLAKQTGFKNLVLPPFEGGKDVSDLYKIDKEKFKTVMFNLFNN